jgi:hypothetical protein
MSSLGSNYFGKRPYQFRPQTGHNSKPTNGKSESFK